jgi:hypothetical protein
VSKKDKKNQPAAERPLLLATIAATIAIAIQKMIGPSIASPLNAYPWRSKQVTLIAARVVSRFLRTPSA